MSIKAVKSLTKKLLDLVDSTPRLKSALTAHPQTDRQTHEDNTLKGKSVGYIWMVRRREGRQVKRYSYRKTFNSMSGNFTN